MFFVDTALFVIAIALLIGGIALSIRLRFVQVRMIPELLRSLFGSLMQKNRGSDKTTVVPHRALFTALSTTLGTSTMISPVLAIKLGGPGALLGYVVATFFGAAMTFAEVSLAVQFRKRAPDGSIMGGPMQYLSHFISTPFAKCYAISCALLMAAWSGAQSNQLAAILASPTLGTFALSEAWTGCLLASFVILFLIGGIRWIAALSGKLVPLMFTLYLGSCLWIIGTNLSLLPAIFSTVWSSLLAPQQFATGAAIGGIVSAMRWGVLKGVHTVEAGVGTQTIPHSMADTTSPHSQAALAMASTYMSGFIAVLSGIVALISDTWQNSALPPGIGMVAATFQLYFAEWGFAIIAVSAVLFAVGTVLGNCFNGTHSFTFLAKNRYNAIYYAVSALFIFLGAISHVTLFWAYADLLMVFVALPHVAALLFIAVRRPELFDKEKKQERELVAVG